MHPVILKFHLFIVQISLYNNKEAYHYEKHLILFANTALIVMGLLWLVHLPLLSRILAVANFTDRHRRRGETDAQITAALRERAGHAFDPQCVEVMCGMLTEKT